MKEYLDGSFHDCQAVLAQRLHILHAQRVPRITRPDCGCHDGRKQMVQPLCITLQSTLLHLQSQAASLQMCVQSQMQIQAQAATFADRIQPDT